MARVAITEYAAKRLCFGDAYTGVSATPETLAEVIDSLTGDGTYVVKIDAGVKKRGKKGLLAVNIATSGLQVAAEELFQKGYERVVIEPFLAHEADTERYLSIELVRDGARVLHSEKGGVDIEDNADSIENHLVPLEETLAASPALTIENVPLSELLSAMRQYHLSFLEINPYVAEDIAFSALDMAAEIDSSKEGKLPEWAQSHVLHKKAASDAEKKVLEQDARTQAALNLHTLNPNGSILTLLSGGGASLVGLDSLVSAGLQEEVINYSEYSGAPTRDETAEYVRTLLGVLFDSTATNKVILIAGGVANFTDVMATFQGIVDAFTDNLAQLKEQQIYVCVRRGGPNQAAGLAHLRDFLDENEIPNDVNDPSLSLGKVGELVKQHV
jgi:succinyl-CoA synthetase beta subunit